VLVQREMERGRSPLVSIARASAGQVPLPDATATGEGISEGPVSSFWVELAVGGWMALFRSARSRPCHHRFQHELPVAVHFGFGLALHVDAHAVVYVGAVVRPVWQTSAFRRLRFDRTPQTETFRNRAPTHLFSSEAEFVASSPSSATRSRLAGHPVM
jgi:hypothetical protein